jgi:peptide/nickel transport system substrate-binding protein
MPVEPYWNQHKLDEARKLVQASGYKGEEVVIIATKEYAELYNLAIVAQQVLKQIGVKSRLDVYDWPTVLQRRQDRKLRSVRWSSPCVRCCISIRSSTLAPNSQV